MKKLIFTIAFLLGLSGVAYSANTTAAVYFRTDCGNLPGTKVAGTLCMQLADASGRKALKLYEWSGSAWVEAFTQTACVSAIGTDAYACNMQPPFSSYDTNRLYYFRADVANTGGATIQFNGIIGPKTIKKLVGGVTVDLVTNDIRADQIVILAYDGTNMQMLSQLGNAVYGGTIGCLPKGATTTTLGDSAVCEDVDSVNSTKKLEIGDSAAVFFGTVYFENNGSGKTRLMVQFPSGSPVQLAIEP